MSHWTPHDNPASVVGTSIDTQAHYTCEDALVSRSRHRCHARAISGSRGSVSQIGRRPRSTDVPKGPAPGPALAGPAARAQSRPPASEQVPALNAQGDDIRPASARHVVRDVDVIALAPSFIDLQWACNRSRGSESAAQSGSRCNPGFRSGVAAGRGSDLQWLGSADSPARSPRPKTARASAPARAAGPRF